jgi:S-adenosyl-L-methionine hydrolase (adenosine-forming)
VTAPITLLTDFGTADGYVGEMKGVIATLAPSSPIIDVTHDIPPQAIDSARLAVARYWRRYPEGTVHLAVVDPGVGASRQALAVESDGRFLVGPDNGVLSPALLIPGARAVSLPIPPGAAPTFHGRDVFAPAAAALATGSALDDLGPPVEDPVILRTPRPRHLGDGGTEGEVVAIDRFGNAITNLPGLTDGSIMVGGMNLPMAATYSEVERLQPVALVGSSGLIEIAVRDGSAADELKLAVGSRIVFNPTRQE